MKHVRQLTAEKLCISLDDLPFKILIPQVIESSLVADLDAKDKNFDGEEVEIKPVVADSCRGICKVYNLLSFLFFWT